jgi:hypothetical protein
MVIDAAMGTAGAFCSSSDAASGVLGTVAGAPMPAPAGRCVVVNPSHPAAGVCKEAAARAGVVAALRYKLESRYAEIASAAALAIAELARCDAVVGGVRRAPFRDLLLEDRTAIALAACLEGVLLRPREEREQLIEAVSHAIATLCSAGVGYLPVDRCGQLLRTAFLPLVPSLLLSHQLTCASRQQPAFESLPALVSLIDACAVLLPQVATTAAHRTVIVAALLSLIDPRGPAVSCARAAVTEVTEASAAASRSPHPASAATVLQEIAARTMPYTEVVSAAVRCIRVLVECGEWAADAAAAGAWRSAAALLIWGAGEDSVVECCDVGGVLIFSCFFFYPTISLQQLKTHVQVFLHLQNSSGRPRPRCDDDDGAGSRPAARRPAADLGAPRCAPAHVEPRRVPDPRHCGQRPAAPAVSRRRVCGFCILEGNDNVFVVFRLLTFLKNISPRAPTAASACTPRRCRTARRCRPR